MIRRMGMLFGLLAVAIFTTYFSSDLISSLFFVSAVVLYLYSKDEALWLTFFLVVSDGFIGFFNNYEAVVSIIPGLPDVEIGHLYVVGTLFKLRKAKSEHPPPFYQNVLAVLLIYTVFLVVQSYAIGVSPELKYHFRILKFLLPLTLFYTIPKIFVSEGQYREVFQFFIPFAFLALFAQVFTVSTGLAPSMAMGVKQDLWFMGNLERGQTYRGFYSTGMVMISFFGALYYLVMDPGSKLRPLFLLVMIADFMSAFLSATRGWVLCFSIVLILYGIFVVRLDLKRILMMTVVGVVLLLGLFQVPAIEKQFSGASDRILTVGLLAKGDVTAGGTLERLDRRAPRVIKKWLDAPLTGWGFSDDYHEYSDSHVGNHNILLQSGVLGALLLAGFFAYFCGAIILRSFAIPDHLPYHYSLLIFPIFLLGWFIIHSTSGQQFQFHGEPGMTIPEALFFSFGAYCYRDSMSAIA